MRSGIGPRAELERHGIRTLADSPGVRANLIDHPQVMMLAELIRDIIGRSEGTDHSRWSVLLRYTATGSQEFNDMQFHLIPIFDWSLVPGFPVEPGTAPMLLVFPGLQRPRSRGRLSLGSASPHDQPNIDLNYSADPENLRRMIDGMRLGWRIIHQPEVAMGWQGPIVGGSGRVHDQATVDSNTALADFILTNCGTVCHPVGTAKMGGL